MIRHSWLPALLILTTMGAMLTTVVNPLPVEASLLNDIDNFAGPQGLGLPAPRSTVGGYFEAIANFLRLVIGSVALLAIVVGGLMYILSFGDEQRSTRAKKIIVFAIAGLIIAGVAEILRDAVLELIDPQITSPTETLKLRSLIGRIIAAILLFLGVAALIAFIWGGYQYVVSLGSEEKSAKGKRTVIYALIGMVIVGISAVLVNALIRII